MTPRSEGAGELHHVSVVVPSIAEALPFYRDTLRMDAGLAERGKAALHHLCFVVDDLRSTLGALEARGTELVDHEPRRGADGDVAFLHPRSSGGVLIELIDRSSLERPHTS